MINHYKEKIEIRLFCTVVFLFDTTVDKKGKGSVKDLDIIEGERFCGHNIVLPNIFFQ